MQKPKNTMSNEMTELLQDKAKEQPKSERLIIRWLDENESPPEGQAERKQP